MSTSRIFRTGTMVAGLLVLLGTASWAENTNHSGHMGGSLTSATVAGGSYASASVSSPESSKPSKPSRVVSGGGVACDLSQFNSHRYTWKVSKRYDCGCGWRKVDSAKKWLCPVPFRAAKK